MGIIAIIALVVAMLAACNTNNRNGENGHQDEVHQEFYPLNFDNAFADALSEPSFAEFINAFSGLWASPDQLEYLNVEGGSGSISGEKLVAALDENLLVQLNALYSLYRTGVGCADVWLEETYIDLSSYEGLLVAFCSETESESYYVAMEDQLKQIEVGFTPNSPEVKALRQALLAPYSMSNEVS